MNDCCPHCIAKHGDKVVGYALSMHPKFADGIEVLKPMFIEINKIISGNAKYIIMGQICVGKNYRKRGIFRGLYNFMKQELQATFNYIITEVDAENLRSLNAHLAVGFEILREYHADNKDWII
ncbi:MAG TPA: GNAT family N-acetyltransferase, partial [Flavobacteriaceae bacterium]